MLSRREFLSLPVLFPFVDIKPKPTIEYGLVFPIVFASQQRSSEKPPGVTAVDLTKFRRVTFLEKLWRVFLPFIK